MSKAKKKFNGKTKISIKNYQNTKDENKLANFKIGHSLSREIKFTIFSIFLIAIAMITTSYAIFTSINKANNFNQIKVGTLQITFNDKENNHDSNIINLNGAFPETDEEGLNETPYSFKITNTGNIDANYTIKITDDQEMINEDNCSNNLLDKSKIKVSINGNEPFLLSNLNSNSYIIKQGILKPNESKINNIRLWITSEAGNEVLNKHYHGKIVIESTNLSVNSNISEGYLYNSNSCQKGTEASCEKTTCYKNKSVGACPIGTIIKYKVNDNTEKYFYVLNDDGENLTLQQTEVTTYNIAWNTTNNPADGPLTAISSIESATTNWTNVNNQSYDKNTNCTITDTTASCSNSLYQIGDRGGKARLISAQEINDMNCISTTCKNIMSGPYWTISTANNNPIYVDSTSQLKTASPSQLMNLKAVIEINK